MCRQQCVACFSLCAVLYALAAEARSTSSGRGARLRVAVRYRIRCHTERAFKQDSVVRNEVADDVGRDARHATQTVKSFGMARRTTLIRSLANGGGKVEAQVTRADAAVFCVHCRTRNVVLPLNRAKRQTRIGDDEMSDALRILHGEFGRVALVLVDKPMAVHAHRVCHIIFKVGGGAIEFGIRERQHRLDARRELQDGCENESRRHGRSA